MPKYYTTDKNKRNTSDYENGLRYNGSLGFLYDLGANSVNFHYYSNYVGRKLGWDTNHDKSPAHDPKVSSVDGGVVDAFRHALTNAFVSNGLWNSIGTYISFTHGDAREEKNMREAFKIYDEDMNKMKEIIESEEVIGKVPAVHPYFIEDQLRKTLMDMHNNRVGYEAGLEEFKAGRSIYEKNGKISEEDVIGSLEKRIVDLTKKDQNTGYSELITSPNDPRIFEMIKEIVDSPSNNRFYKFAENFKFDEKFHESSQMQAHTYDAISIGYDDQSKYVPGDIHNIFRASQKVLSEHNSYYELESKRFSKKKSYHTDAEVCFLGSVEISTPSGPVPIMNIKIGDSVFGFESPNSDLITGVVSEIHSHYVDEILNMGAVSVTATHPFLLSDGSFKAIGDVTENEWLVCGDGSLSRRPDIIKIKGNFKVYNITVERCHTYVAGGWRVHNKNIPPILLDMGFGIETIDSGKVMYDWDEKGGRRVSTGWAGRKTGMLAVDLDGNGKIEGPDELSMARHKPGAMTDLAGLSAFDSNGDGLLSGLDAMFPKFGVWIDANQDGLTDSGEFRTLETAGISAITLEPTQVTPGRAMGKNPLHGIGRFRWADGSDGALADVAFALDRQGLSREADALSWRLDIPSGLPVPVSDLEGATAPTGSAGAYAPSRTVLPDFPGGKQKKHRHRATEWQATEWQAGQTDRLPTSSQNLPMADPPMSAPLTLPVLTLQPKRRRSLAQPAEGGQERSISLPPQPVESYRGTLTPEELYRLKHGLSLEQILRQGAGDSRLYQD
jgi:hypothetical protein